MGVVTDSIADMLTRIRNANAARHGSVSVPASRMKLEIARVLKSEGFIAGYDVVQREKQGEIRIQLRYGPRKEHVLLGLRRVSRPGLRIYANRETIPRVQGGLGVAILSTSRGIMTDKEARRAGIGGEVVAYIW